MHALLRHLTQALHAIAKRVFWAMPGILRDRLHDARHLLVRWFRVRTVSGGDKRTDISWPEFEKNYLERNYLFTFIIETNVDWNITLYQRPHHLARALGRKNCLVLYRTTGDNVVGVRPIADNVWLVNTDQVDTINNAIRCFYSTSLFASADDLLSASNKGMVVYEYIDHIDPSISGGATNLRRLQKLKQAAFADADLIVSSASTLHHEALSACGKVRCVSIPNGVDVAHYQNVIPTQSLPNNLLDFRRRYSQIVGYFGAIAPWLWYDLLSDVATKMPDIGFIFIGPDYSGCIRRLPRLNNCLYIGPVNYGVLPSYARLFDICFIPFIPGEIARSTSPLKLYEYFALGKPVVVTSDMAECTAFEEVFSGKNATEITDAIKKALSAKADSAFVGRLRALADDNSWDVRATTYITALSMLKRIDQS